MTCQTRRSTTTRQSDREAREEPATPAGTPEDLLERYARAPSPATLHAAVDAWRRTAERLSLEARLELLARVVARSACSELSCRALLPIVLGEPEGRVVAVAVARLVTAHRPDADDPEPGPFYVLKHALTAEAENLGAVLGALLGLGDPATARWIFELRHLLAHPSLGAALAEMTRYHPGVVHKATVTFYLDWLDELALQLPASAKTFGRVANALTELRTRAASDQPLDGGVHQPTHGEHHHHGDGSHRIPLHELTWSVWFRLAAIERAVPPSAPLRRALEAWSPSRRY